jgi:hypothetical protein
MPIRNLLIAFVLASALGGFIWWDSKKPKVDGPQEVGGEPVVKPTELLKLDRDQIQQLEVQRAQDSLVLRKNILNRWELSQTDGRNSPVDPEKLNELFVALNPLKSRRVFENVSAASYGVDTAPTKVIITLKDGSTRVIQLGDELPTGGDYYGQVQGDKRIGIFNASDVALFAASSQSLRDKRILPVDTTEVSTIEYATGKETVLMQREGKTWKMLQPAAYRIRRSAIENVLGSIDSSKMEFVSAEAAATQATEFNSAAMVAILTVTESNGTKQRAEVRRTGEGRYLAKSSALDQVVQINDEVGGSFKRDLAAFRNDDLFEFGFDDLDRISVDDAGKKRELRRDGLKWFEGKTPMDAVAATALVDKLRALKASDLPANGPNQPNLTITVAYEGRQETVRLTPDGESFIGRRQDDPWLYRINAALIRELLIALSDIKPDSTKAKK